MKHAAVHNTATHHGSSVSIRRPTPGANGIAIAPPTYRIDFADRQQSPDEETAIQRQVGTDSDALQKQPHNRTGLPDSLKAGIETLSGLSLDDVRVHYNSTKPAALRALAYTQGADIHVGPGQEKHLPHEAWHVVQQQQGQVRPRKLGSGLYFSSRRKSGPPMRKLVSIRYTSPSTLFYARLIFSLTVAESLYVPRPGWRQ
jgi:hypothetical protein